MHPNNYINQYQYWFAYAYWHWHAYAISSTLYRERSQEKLRIRRLILLFERFFSVPMYKAKTWWQMLTIEKEILEIFALFTSTQPESKEQEFRK